MRFFFAYVSDILIIEIFQRFARGVNKQDKIEYHTISLDCVLPERRLLVVLPHGPMDLLSPWLIAFIWNETWIPNLPHNDTIGASCLPLLSSARLLMKFYYLNGETTRVCNINELWNMKILIILREGKSTEL